MTAIPVRLWAPGVTYPTDDGRTLQLKSDVVSAVDFEIAFTPDLEDPDASTFDSVVRTTFRMSDIRGDVWQLVSYWSTAMLVEALMDLSVPFASRKWSSMGEGLRRSFEQNLILEGLSFGSDSREGYQIVIEDEVADVVFHYTSIGFDLGLRPGIDELALMPDLLARTTKSGTTLFYHGTADELPQLVFPVRWSRLLASNLAFDEDQQIWRYSDFPAPLIAIKTNQRGQPQDSVLIT